MIKKVIYYRLELKDQLAIYAPNKAETILNILRERFEGICYAGAFIKKITSILNDPQYIFSRSKFDGRVACDVQFEAECIAPTRGTIMVAQFDVYMDQKIKLKTDYCELLITKNKLITDFTDACFVPIVIQDAMCNIGNKIAALGRMYFGGNRDMVFKTHGITEPSADIKKTIKLFVTKITALKKAVDNKIGKKLLALFHPFKKDKVLSNPIDVLNYKFSPGDKLLKRTPHCMIDKCLLFKINKPSSEDVMRINLKTEDLVLLEILQDTVNYLNMIKFYVDKYDDKSWNDNKIVWDIYRKIQK